jgi:hypothetical protein
MLTEEGSQPRIQKLSSLVAGKHFHPVFHLTLRINAITLSVASLFLFSKNTHLKREAYQLKILGSSWSLNAHIADVRHQPCSTTRSTLANLALESHHLCFCFLTGHTLEWRLLEIIHGEAVHTISQDILNHLLHDRFIEVCELQYLTGMTLHQRPHQPLSLQVPAADIWYSFHGKEQLA